MRKNPEANLKLKYKKVIELSMVLSLVIMLLVFQTLRAIDLDETESKKLDIEIEVTDIPPTEQFKRPPPPPKPSIPIPTESEDVPEDLTIEANALDLSDIPPPPPPPDDGDMIFVAFDEPPTPKGGFRSIQKALKYPEIARKAGIEGRVTVHVLVSEKGIVIKTKILQSLGHTGCDQAAVNAIKKVRWNPAMQRDKPVRVWVAIPVIFRLK